VTFVRPPPKHMALCSDYTTLVEKLSSLTSSVDEPILGCSDGSVLNNRYGGVGVSLVDLMNDMATWRIHVGGGLVTSTDAEWEGLRSVVVANSIAQQHLLLYCDNSAAVQYANVALGIADGSLPLSKLPRWNFLSIMCASDSLKLQFGKVGVKWSPGHGRREDWQASGAWSTNSIREHNRIADLEAGKASEEYTVAIGLPTWVDERKLQVDLARSHLKRLHGNLLEFISSDDLLCNAEFVIASVEQKDSAFC
jgi:uncharacterized coiled-coil protein SlyX